MVECKLCGKLMKGLTLHLLKIHQVTPAAYCTQHPGAKIFSDEVTSKPGFGGNASKGKKRSKPISEETRAKISEARKKRVGWKHTDEARAKMQATSQRDDVMEARRASSIKRYEDNPELRVQVSNAAKARIAKHGFHLKRGKTTALEQVVIDLLNGLNLRYTREMRSSALILNAYRFFDFHVPALNLVIEADGEFWHRQELRVEIDRLKEADVRASGFNFLRVSDKDLTDTIRQTLIEKTWDEHTASTWANRMAYISIHGYASASNDTNPMKPEERIKVLSETSKSSWERRKADGWTMSDETKQKISESRAGKTFGPREKPYKITKPRPPTTNETRAKMSERAQARKPVSEETKARMKASHAARRARLLEEQSVPQAIT
jgi:very-short-patch-repair endonuclease